MKELKSEILINAPREKVWAVLTDFESYPAWNPFIREISGKLQMNEQLRCVIDPGDSPYTFTPVVTELEAVSRFAWLGSLPLGMFKGNHYFYLEEAGEGLTRVIHGERFSGWLMRPIMRMIGEKTLKGFEAMNLALKMRVEN